ncbi:hypothetical protein [Winogradskyella wandonensis]|nr:hypothetical protein [Winogradskyella wandonensis]
MKRILILFLLINTICYSQTKTSDGIEIVIKKARLVDNISIVGIRQLKVKSNELRKVMIKTKIKSKPDNKVKLSAFSLVDTINKIRYRLADYKGYTGFVGLPELIPFRKSKIYNKKGKEIDTGPPYDRWEKDYFDNYNKEGYTNFEVPVNFGTKDNPQLSIVYFGETDYKKFTAELFFTVLVKNTGLSYELYYKDEKISDIKF